MKITLQELLDFKNSSKDNEEILKSEKITVKTRHGHFPIQEVDVTAKNSDFIEFRTFNGKHIISSPKHLFWSVENKEWKFAAEFSEGEHFQTENGADRIISISNSTTKKDLLDIQVKEVKEFYANGIVSHNSTIAKALKFVLFGKVDGIRLQDVPNRINKNAFGKVELIAKNQHIVVERGQAPGHFKLIVNGEPEDKAGKKDVQKYLEEEFLGFNFSVFSNILILSINDFKSFLTMKPSDKRRIIDKIFGFYIINEMKEKVKKERKLLRTDLARIEGALNEIDSTIKHTLDKLDKLKEKSEKANKSKALKLKEQIKELQVKKEELNEKYQKLATKVKDTRSSRMQFSNDMASMSERIRTLEKTLNLYKKSACPTCQSPLDTPFHKEILEKTQSDIDDIRASKEETSKKIEELKETLNKASAFENSIIKDIQKLDSLVESKKREIKDFLEVNGTNTHELDSLINEFEEKKANEKIKLESSLENETFLNILEEDILSDEGVKSLAIRAIIPVLNKSIEKFSKELNSQFNIEFDQNFDCQVKHLGEEVNPNTLSEGERKKADLIIIIAMIEILKLRYPNMNLLFLDELFSSLDQENINKILYVLKHMLDTLNINIFVISHTELPVQMFDKIMHVYKKGNFSAFNMYSDLTQIPENDK